MSAIREDTTVSLLQKFSKTLSLGEKFSLQRATDYVHGFDPNKSSGTVQTGIRSMTTNASGRLKDYRIVKDKEWQDGKNRDLFFQEDDGLYRLYVQGQDHEPLYYDRIKTEAVELAKDEEELAKEGPIPDYGPKEPFYPLRPETWPSCLCVYAIETRRKGTYTYVGEGDGQKRLKSHFEKYWFRGAFVHRGWFVRCDDKLKRKLLEQILINAFRPIINVMHVDDDDEEEETS
jgi:hypothetical protein